MLLVPQTAAATGRAVLCPSVCLFIFPWCLVLLCLQVYSGVFCCFFFSSFFFFQVSATSPAEGHVQFVLLFHLSFFFSLDLSPLFMFFFAFLPFSLSVS